MPTGILLKFNRLIANTQFLKDFSAYFCLPGSDLETDEPLSKLFSNTLLSRYYEVEIFGAALQEDSYDTEPIRQNVICRPLKDLDEYTLSFSFPVEDAVITDVLSSFKNSFHMKFKKSALLSNINSSYEDICRGAQVKPNFIDRDSSLNHQISNVYIQLSSSLISSDENINTEYITQSSHQNFEPSNMFFFDEFLEQLSTQLSSLYLAYKTFSRANFELPKSYTTYPIFSCKNLELPLSIRCDFVFFEILVYLMSCLYEEKTVILGESVQDQSISLSSVWEEFLFAYLYENSFWKLSFPFLFDEASKLQHHRVQSNFVLAEEKNKIHVFILQTIYPLAFDFDLYIHDPKKSYHILAHKSVLRQSSFFSGLIELGSSEFTSKIESCPSPFLLLAIGYMYNKTIPDLTAIQCLKLLRTADYLCIRPLTKVCENKLKEQFHNFICVCDECSKALLVFARAVFYYPECSLLEATYNTLIDNCTTFWPLPGFIKLPDLMKKEILRKAHKKINHETVYYHLPSFHYLYSKYSGKSQISSRALYDIAEELLRQCYQTIANHFLSDFLKDNSPISILLSKGNKNDGLLKDLFDSILPLFPMKDIVKTWLSMEDYINHLFYPSCNEVDPEEPVELNMDQKYLKNLLEAFLIQLKDFIIRNQFKIHIQGGFKNIKDEKVRMVLNKEKLGNKNGLVDTQYPDQDEDLRSLHIISDPYQQGSSQAPVKKISKSSLKLKRRTVPSLPQPSQGSSLRFSELKMNLPVQLKDPVRLGQIKYIGNPQFAPGSWVGIELNDPVGKSDGEVQGVRYFQARPQHVLFVRPEKCFRLSRK